MSPPALPRTPALLQTNAPSSDYTHFRELSARLGEQEVRFFSKPGLPSWEAWDQISPSAALLVDHAALAPKAHAAWLGCSHAAAAALFARKFPQAEFTLVDPSILALQAAGETLRLNQVANARIHAGLSLMPEQAGGFDAVLIDLPKGRKLVQRWLAEAFALLRPDGQLYMAGASDQGIQPAVKDAAGLFGAPGVLAYKKGNRVVRFVKRADSQAQPDWALEPGVQPGTWLEVPLHPPQGKMRLFSLPGIFSSTSLDEGTALLLASLPDLAGAQVLDLGCGYGVIGIAAVLAGAAHVDLLDASLLAVAATAENLAWLGLSNASVYASDVLSAVSGRRYRFILSNPPFHTGRSVDYQVAEAFIRQSHAALEPGGELWLVANQFIRYDRLLEPVFGNFRIAAGSSRFLVLQASKA